MTTSYTYNFLTFPNVSETNYKKRFKYIPSPTLYKQTELKFLTLPNQTNYLCKIRLSSRRNYFDWILINLFNLVPGYLNSET